LVVKTGISLPDEVYNELASIARVMGYGSISKAVRDAVEMFIAFNRWWTAKGNVFGTIQVLIPAGKPAVEEKLLNIERNYGRIIRLSIRIPFNADYMLQLLIVDGDGEEVKKLYKQLVRIDGILAVQASLLPGITSQPVKE
jgi:CopG family nickel-responsive transcriptional regulator